MLIDCDTCTVRGAACDGCMVHALLEIGRGVERIESAEADAIEVFTRAGFEVTVLDGPAGLHAQGALSPYDAQGALLPYDAARPQRRAGRGRRSGRRRAA